MDARLEDFELGALLGQGGMATVHRAVWLTNGLEVALKLIQGNVSDDPTHLERFRREARAAMALSHDNICRVYAAGEGDDGRLFMAMEIVDGGSVRDLKQRCGGSLPAALAIEIIGQLLAALDVAHRAGIVHRDLKPANLMLTRAGVLKLVDFGIARSSSDNTLTATGMLVGTPAFMSPEQVQGETLDGRSDLFSAGLVLHELLCGKSPYHADNPGTSLVKVLKDEVPNTFDVLFGIDPAIEAFHSKLTAKDVNDRYADAATALKALQPILDEQRRRRPQLLAEALRDPRGVRAQLVREQAAAEFARGQRLVEQHGHVVAAALAFENATQLDASLTEAFDELAATSAALDFHTDVRIDARIAEAQQALSTSPAHPGVLKRLADLHRAAGNMREAARYLKRYLRQKDDAAALQQLVVMLWGPNADPALVTGTLHRLRTRDIVAGVKTGGMPALRPDKPAAASAFSPTQRAAMAEATARARNDVVAMSADIDEGFFSRLHERFGAWLWVGVGAVVVVAGIAVAARGTSALVHTAQKDLKAHAEGEVIADENAVFGYQGTKLNEAKNALERGSYVACSVAAAQSLAGESTAKLVLDAKWLIAQCSLLAGDVSAAADALQDFKDNANIKDRRFELAKAQLAAIARGEVPVGLQRY